MKRFGILLALLPAATLAEIRYSLTPEPSAQMIRVTMTVDSTEPNQEFRIPAWCPGFYFLLRYEQKVSDVRAFAADGSTLAVRRTPDGAGWLVANPSRDKMTLSYRVLGDDPGLGFFGVNVREDKAFVNGPAAFMYLPGRKQEPTRLKLVLPQGWQVATGMEQAEGGDYICGDYDELLDHPLQLGAFERKRFTVEGIPFEAVYVSPNNRFTADLEALTDELRRISRPAILMFGSAPFKRYTYIVHLAVGDFAGGLEHRSSTVLAMPDSRRLRLAELASHELFHAWNVKQIRPKVLGPFDYTKEVRTANLWFAEGVTDYYANLMVYRSHDRDAEWLYAQLAGQIEQLQRSRVRREKTLEEVSLLAWENGGFGIGDLSYYNKGLVAGLLFDAAIREATQGAKSLDDVMRLLYQRHRLPNPGYEEGGILEALNEIAGKDLSDIYRQVVRTTAEMPYELLKGIGLRLIAPGQPSASLGFELAGTRVAQVMDANLASVLQVGDVIEQVEGRAFAEGAFARFNPGDPFVIRVRRGEQSFELRLVMGSQTARNYRLEPDPFATASAKRNLQGWLERPRPAP